MLARAVCRLSCSPRLNSPFTRPDWSTNNTAEAVACGAALRGDARGFDQGRTDVAGAVVPDVLLYPFTSRGDWRWRIRPKFRQKSTSDGLCPSHAPRSHGNALHGNCRRHRS